MITDYHSWTRMLVSLKVVNESWQKTHSIRVSMSVKYRF